MNISLIYIKKTILKIPLLVKLLPKNQYQKRYIRGIAWSFIGSFISQLLSLVATIPVARLLTAKGYGELGIIQSTLMTFVIFSGPSLGQTATKYIAEFHQNAPERVGKIIGLTSIIGLFISACLGITLYIGAPYLAQQALNAPQLSRSLTIAAIVLFLNGVNGAQSGILLGFEKFELIAKVNIMRGLLSLPLMVIGAKYGGIEGVIISLAVVSFFTTCITQIIILKVTHEEGIKIDYWKSFYEWRILTAFYIPTVLSSFVVMPVIWITNTLLVNQQNGYIEMGIFNATNQWRMAIQYLPSVISQPILPILSSLYSNKLVDEFSKILKNNLFATFIISLLPSLLISISSKWIMQAYGREFTRGINVLVIMALTTVLISTSGVIGLAISSMGKRWHAAGLNFVWAILFLSFSHFLVRFGAIGLAFSYFGSYIIHFVNVSAYSIFVVRKTIRN